MDSFGRFATVNTRVPYAAGYLLTEESPRAPTPARFRLPLMTIQCATLYSMITMETYKNWNSAYYTRCGVLSNAMASGKTANIIALIEANGMPTKGPLYPMAININPREGKRRIGGRSHGVILQRYKTVMRPTLIFTGESVLEQWAGEFKKFCPALRIYMIENLKTLMKFYTDILHTPELNNYDAILVKNKVITGKWIWQHGEQPGNELNKVSKDIYNMIGTMCRDMCFARVVIDDFDTIGLPAVHTHINSLFTWFVSCTKRKSANRHWKNAYATIEDIAANSAVMYKQIIEDQILYGLFNLQVCPEFVKTCMSIGKIQVFVNTYKDQARKVAKLINCLAGDKVSSIMEALNGDSYDQAAKIAGIEAGSVTDIFKKLFNDNYELMIESNRVLALIDKFYIRYINPPNPAYDALTEMHLNPDQEDTFTRKHLRAGRIPEYRYPGMSSLIQDEEKKWNDSSRETTESLKKIRDAVSADECGICSMPLTGNSNCILPCCFEILHADCANRGCNFAIQSVKGVADNIGYCPFNKTHRVRYVDMCYMGAEFDLAAIHAPAVVGGETKSEEKPVVGIVIPTDPRTKFDGLLDLLLNRHTDERKLSAVALPVVASGSISLGAPAYETDWRDAWASSPYSGAVTRMILQWISPDAVPRVLIFSNFDSNLAKIETMLQKACIRYKTLGSGSKNIDKSRTDFDAGIHTCLVINSVEKCSGLNLQSATDTVLMHYIHDVSTKVQTYGRILRNGRKCDPRIHHMFYELETEAFSNRT